MKLAEVAQQQAALLIDLMAQGNPFLPFLKPGDPHTINQMPYNPTTGRAYRGGNRVMLWIVSMVHDYEDTRWLTYKQAQSLGAQVRKGEKSIPLRRVIYPDERDANGALVMPGIDTPKSFPFNVFNASQVDGLPPPPVRPELTPVERMERCDALLKATGAVIEYGSAQPHYSPRSDKIGLPYPERFISRDAFYAVAMHELAHWSGAPHRLNRDLSGAFGSESYAREEMVAEVASHVIGVELQIGHDPHQHAAYIHHWMRIAKEDPSYLYTAASQAEKVCDFIGLERFRFEPLLKDVEQDLEGVPLVFPAIEDAKPIARSMVNDIEM